MAASTSEPDVTRSNSARNLGIAIDAVSIGAQGVTWGFDIAKHATNAGFGFASACLRKPAAALEATAGPNGLSSFLHGANSAMDFAHKATTASQDLTRTITHASLNLTKSGLVAAGGREGELLKAAVGEEAAEAIVAIEATVRNFAAPVPLPSLLAPSLWVAARAWGAMQRAALSCGAALPPRGVALPADCERCFRFTAATFWRGGLIEGPWAAACVQGETPAEQALSAAGLTGCIEVLALEENRSRELFAPGYMVAVDHDHGRVVVALRGTSSVADVMADLVCEPAAVQLGGHDGLAHRGMLLAAQRLDALLAALVEDGLGRLGTGAVVLCGHSLGAGVAALIAALWRDAGRFPGVRVECLAFACPQVLDEELALAQSNHTTCLVLGDDMVPRLSKATATDLRNAMLTLSGAGQSGLPGSADVLAAEARGDTTALGSAYVVVRPEVCTSSGRLFPAGRIVQLRAGKEPQEVGHEAVDELIVSSDMGAAHLPRRYLLAIQEARQGWGT